jgi:hypothetical protein
MDPETFLFVYGSLVVPADEAHGAVITLRDHVRDWSVAMDNRLTLPGYKYYTLDSERPACHVAFLTVVPQAGATVNGVAVPADEAALARYDHRERNYERVDVTDLVAPAPAGRVWTYVASAAGTRRYERALAEGSGVVHEGYLDAVQAGFAALGEEELARYRASTRPPPFPVLPLERHNVPT